MSHITRRQAGHGDREKGVGFTQGGMHIKEYKGIRLSELCFWPQKKCSERMKHYIIGDVNL